jgi:Ca2+-binding RTX toxin-like protein
VCAQSRASSSRSLKLLGDSANNAFGNAGSNVLTGNNAANTLYGGAGDDLAGYDLSADAGYGNQYDECDRKVFGGL